MFQPLPPKHCREAAVFLLLMLRCSDPARSYASSRIHPLALHTTKNLQHFSSPCRVPAKTALSCVSVPVFFFCSFTYLHQDIAEKPPQQVTATDKHTNMQILLTALPLGMSKPTLHTPKNHN